MFSAGGGSRASLSTGQGGGRTFDNDSQQYVHYLASIVHSEPVVERCIDVIVSNTLMKGISCMTADGNQYATPAFREFVNDEYGRFARDAIRMFYVLGFVVWRIVRKRVKGVVQSVPEVFPLGTFTWNVRTRDKPDANKDSLLYYDVKLTGIDCQCHVFEFSKPDLTMHCVSPLASVISAYIRLQVTRACKMRCEEWNASVKMTVELSEKMQTNQLGDDGTVLQGSAGNPYFESFFEDGLAEATASRAGVVKQQAADAKMPVNTHLFVLPKNHTARQLDAVDPPMGVPEAESEFQRLVCYAMGVPCSLVLQSYTVSTTSVASGGANDGAHGLQMLRSSCTRVAHSVCELLHLVYTESYARDSGGSGAQKALPFKTKDRDNVVFSISCSSVLPVSEIAELHFRQLVHDNAVSEMLSSAIGYPLNTSALRLPWNRTVQKPSDPVSAPHINTSPPRAAKQKESDT